MQKKQRLELEKKLKSLGFYVIYHHYRKYRHPVGGYIQLSVKEAKSRLFNNLHPKGGQTCAEVKMYCNGSTYCSGIANCSMDDNFCKETGRQIALRRAISAIFEIEYQKEELQKVLFPSTVKK